MRKLRAAVIGVGYLGNFHAQKYAQLENVDLFAVVDSDRERANEIAAKYGARAVVDYAHVLPEIDLVSIVVPPSRHYDITFDCLTAGVHTLVEKPVTETVEEAEKLIRLATERGRVLQVGHLERFNPAVQALRQHAQQPQRVEAQRLSVYQSRGTEVDVVLDLMIHDIDIVLSLVKSPIKSVHSSGTAVVTSDIDIAHARIEFDDGCVAELAASRVSQEPMRVMKAYKGESYFAIDYITHELQIGAVVDGHERQVRREVTFETGTIGRPDVLMAEISSFVGAVSSGSTPEVTGEDGKRALGVAIDVSQRIKRHRKAGISPDTQSG